MADPTTSIEYSVISHTHWDREWYLPLEVFRLKLVDLVDNLFAILEKNSDFVFHLDAQTIVVDDYLAVRPRMASRLEAAVRSGRIYIGPWYVQNDFYYTSGESTVRNLLIGIDEAQRLGGSLRVGYVPDQFGLISQLPQILRGFDIADVLFGRGYDFFDDVDGQLVRRSDPPTEFVWRSPDGSEVLAVHMASWYNNAQRFSEDIGRSKLLVEKIESEIGHRTSAPLRLCMNGVDHLEAQENLTSILGRLNDALPEGRTIRQRALDDWFADLRTHLRLESLSIWDGELRNGDRYQILANTASSRVYLKQTNARLQWQIEGVLEPFASTYLAYGIPELYPYETLRFAWKRLISNHAHDSICGCSCDAVHRHMEDRFEAIRETATELEHRILDDLAARMDPDNASADEYTITVFNGTEIERGGVVEADVHIPVSEAWPSFSIHDPTGRPIRFTVLESRCIERSLFSPINLPGGLLVDAYRIRIEVPPVPPVGAVRLSVRRVETAFAERVPPKESASDAAAGLFIRNDAVAIEVQGDGSITLVDIPSGRRLPNVVELYDETDAGDAYVHRETNEAPISAVGTLRRAPLIERCELVRSATLVYDLKLPTELDPQASRRTDDLTTIPVTMKIAIVGDEPLVHFSVSFRNCVRDHRIRVRLNSGIAGTGTHAASPFSSELRDRRSIDPRLRNGDQPTSGYVAITDGRRSFGVVTSGLHEYEHLSDTGQIALTLLRANGFIFRFDEEVKPPHHTWLVPENQIQRDVDVSFAILAEEKPFDALRWHRMLRAFSLPLRAHYRSTDERKFVGGRPAVQDTEITEIFHRTRTHAERRLPQRLSLLRIDGGLVLSAVKRAEQSDAMVVRLFNPGDEPVSARLTFAGPPRTVWLTSLAETRRDPVAVAADGSVDVTAQARSIVSVLAEFPPAGQDTP